MLAEKFGLTFLVKVVVTVEQIPVLVKNIVVAVAVAIKNKVKQDGLGHPVFLI